MDQIVQIVGAILILVAFIAAQAGRVSPQARSYLILNLVGSVILAGVAAYEFDLGFLLLEVAWALVSAWGLIQLMRGRAPSPAH
jgi:hypothetical protein